MRIGRKSIVIPGRRIGGDDGAAYSVVIRNVPPCEIVGGNPAWLLRMRFGQEMIGLLRLKWGDFAPVALLKSLPSLCSPEPEKVKEVLQAN